MKQTAKKPYFQKMSWIITKLMIEDFLGDVSEENAFEFN